MAPKLEIAATNLIKVEKGIPLSKGGRRGSPSKYPWMAMEVGDSFAVPSEVRIDNFRRQAALMGATHQRQFFVRAVDGGYRCWRVS